MEKLEVLRGAICLDCQVPKLEASIKVPRYFVPDMSLKREIREAGRRLCGSAWKPLLAQWGKRNCSEDILENRDCMHLAANSRNERVECESCSVC